LNCNTAAGAAASQRINLRNLRNLREITIPLRVFSWSKEPRNQGNIIPKFLNSLEKKPLRIAKIVFFVSKMKQNCSKNHVKLFKSYHFLKKICIFAAEGCESGIVF
jgi:hypothetical protein